MIGYEGKWCCYFWFVGWASISLGFSLWVAAPNVEIHIPFGFVRIGRNRAADSWAPRGWVCMTKAKALDVTRAFNKATVNKAYSDLEALARALPQ